MAFVTTGLPANGRTQYFNFQYDDTLSAARGLDLTTEVMSHSDDDLAMIAGWFSGRQLDMSPPIHASICSAATDGAGNPTGALGGSWMGAVFVPLQLTITIGEFPMGSGTPAMLARYLLVSEVSEMYMRAFNAHGPNPWFRSFGEGNKGEALSRFLAAQFLLTAYPQAGAIPSLVFPSGAGLWNVSNLWLDTERENWLEVNDEDIQPDKFIGCGTLFLFYLHDQLGYRTEDIINAGAGHLSNVYENLTGERATNAWPNFSGLVNTHYPHDAQFRPSVNPPLDTLFPVSDLSTLTATPQVSWVSAAMPPVVVVGVDHPAKEKLAVDITSSHPAIVAPLSVTIAPSSTRSITPMIVKPQPSGFTSQLVTLTATYAGRTLTTSPRVVSPQPEGLPELAIDVDRTADLCRPTFIEGTEQVFEITNLYVFADQTGLTFDWSVQGATPDATDTPQLRIAALPSAGSDVAIGVTVKSAQGLSAAGKVAFRPRALDLRIQHQELRCRVNQLVNLNHSMYIPEWVSNGKGEGQRQRLKVLEQQVRSVTQEASTVTKLIRTMEQRS